MKTALLLLLTTLTLYSASFELGSIKRNSSGDVVENGLKIDEEKSIVVTGYGNSPKQALKNAFTTAVEQYVGVIVDSETIAKNGKLISDKILTASSGFIKSYRKIGSGKKDGLFQVKIRAIVKSQKVFTKVKNLHIATKSLDNSSNIYAKVLTKAKAKEDAQRLLKKEFDALTSNDSLQDMVDISIKDVKVLEDDAKDGMVPINIEYTLSFNYDVYMQKVHKLETLFKSLGAKYRKRYDLVDAEGYSPYNGSRINKLTTNDFGIMKKYGQKYKLDVWSFPKYVKELPLKYRSLNFESNFQVVLEIQDKKSNVLLAESTHEPLVNFHPLISHYEYGYKNYFVRGYFNLIRPFLRTKIKQVNFTQKVMLNIEDLAKIKNITVELEQL